MVFRGGSFTSYGRNFSKQNVYNRGTCCVTSIYAAWHIGIASSSKFVASSSSVVVCRHTLYSGQYLKNGMSDLIQIWHMDVAGPGGVLYSFMPLNSH